MPHGNGRLRIALGEPRARLRQDRVAFEESYTEDGDSVSPPFARAFGFATFDPAAREANVLGTATDSVGATWHFVGCVSYR